MNEKEKIIRKIKKQVKGITLVSLVVTIIILLILAGVTLSLTIGNNGIIKKAFEAVEQTEIAGEKEIVQISAFESQMKNEKMILEEEEFQMAMDNNTSEGETEVADVGEEFEVIFWEKNRYYTVDKDGQIIGEGEIIEDENPGDITTGKDGEELDGSEEHPYEIWCIEDLCAFSNEVNNRKNNFRGKYVKLMTNLNFKSKLSYVNGNIKVDGNIKNCNSIEELKKLLTETEGFCSIGDSVNTENGFVGTFDGNYKEIKNVYINKTGMVVGFFGYSFVQEDNMTIKDLKISGDMTGDIVGGICGKVINTNSNKLVKIENCISDININGEEKTGGIIGEIGNAGGTIIISNCINNSTVEGKSSVGGIVGLHFNNNARIINCYNTGTLTGENSVGGIIGSDIRTSIIINSYNMGDIKSNDKAGGIIGSMEWAERKIENCYSIGRIFGKTVGGIIGGINTSNELLITQNCYYLNINTEKGIGGWDSNRESLEDIIGKNEVEMKSMKTLEKLNNYVTENEIVEGIKLKQWTLGENGYPTFVE